MGIREIKKKKPGGDPRNKKKKPGGDPRWGSETKRGIYTGMSLFIALFFIIYVTDI